MRNKICNSYLSAVKENDVTNNRNLLKQLRKKAYKITIDHAIPTKKKRKQYEKGYSLTIVK